MQLRAASPPQFGTLTSFLRHIDAQRADGDGRRYCRTDEEEEEQQKQPPAR